MKHDDREPSLFIKSKYDIIDRCRTWRHSQWRCELLSLWRHTHTQRKKNIGLTLKN